MSSVLFLIAMVRAAPHGATPLVSVIIGLTVAMVTAAFVRTWFAARGDEATPPSRCDIERARLEYGSSHISCFAGSAGKRALDACDGVVAYAVKGRVAVAVGDPLTERSRRVEGASRFIDLCRRNHRIPCFFQTDPSLRDDYRRLGLRPVKFGEEAIVVLADFDLNAAAHANARREVGRARRAGLTPAVLRWPDPDDEIWTELAEVSRSWLLSHGGSEMGFSLGRFREMVDAQSWLTVARDAAGRIHAFATWLRIGHDGAALDLVRRRPDAAPGAVDMCVIAAVEEARRLRLSRVSLGLVPFRDQLGDATVGLFVRLLRSLIFVHGIRGYRYESLARFKGKFATRWESRDVVLPGGVKWLPVLVALILLHLEQPRLKRIPNRRLEVAA